MQIGPVWLVNSNQHFHILNNLLHISTHFFIRMYIKNTQTTLLKLTNQIVICAISIANIIGLPPYIRCFKLQ